MDTALLHVGTVEQHVAIAARRIAGDEDGFLPLVDITEDRRLLAGHPGRRGPEVRGQFQVEVGLLVILAVGDLLAAGGHGAGLAVLQQRGHADDVLRLDVVAVLRVRGDHAHQFLQGGGHDVDLDAVLAELVHQLLLPAEDLRRVDLDGLHLVAFVVGGGDRLAIGHQLVDVTLQLAQGEAGEHLGDPGIADQVVHFAEAVVIAVEAFLVALHVLEGNQLERGVELLAGEHALHFQEGQQGLLQVIAIAGVVHVENGEVALPGVLGDQRVQLLGRRFGPVLELGGGLGGAGQPQAQNGGHECLGDLHLLIP
ncbi:hypothetical protein FQZ97_751210 [compost metagenome]